MKQASGTANHLWDRSPSDSKERNQISFKRRSLSGGRLFLFDFEEAYADWLDALYRATSRSKRPSLGIYAEDRHVVGVLVGHKEECTRRIYAEIAGRPASGRLLLDQGKLTCLPIDGEYRYAVVTAVGTVDEIATGMDPNLGCRVVTREILGQGGNRLDGFERSSFNIMRKSSNLGGHLQVHVGELA